MNKFTQQVSMAFTRQGLGYITSRIPSMVFWATICSILLTLGQVAYQRNVTGDYLLNVKSATTEKKVEVGEPISFSFCRSPRYAGIVSYRNIRSFYLVKETGQRIPVEQRILPDVAYEVTTDPCIVLDIAPTSAPQVPGRYKFCQQIQFKAWGYDKQANFCSTEWQLVPDGQSPPANGIKDQPAAQ